jgi:hypothetical protein
MDNEESDSAIKLYSPSIDVHDVKKKARCVSSQQFESTLRVFHTLDTQQNKEVEAVHQECSED